jgi:hypothetical protein
MNETPKFQVRFPPLVLHRFVNCLEISESVVRRGGRRGRGKLNKARIDTHLISLPASPRSSPARPPSRGRSPPETHHMRRWLC